MSSFQRLGIDEQRVRSQLDKLDWSAPLTTADISAQLADLPRRPVRRHSQWADFPHAR